VTATLPDPFLRDALTLCGRHFARLRELVAQVPPGLLNARLGAAGLSVAQTVVHVCEAERWYMALIDGTAPEPSAPAAPDVDSLLSALDGAEAAMRGFLRALDPRLLEETRPVPAWWAADEPCSVRLILMHSLAHKYYHSGQVQSLLHDLAAGDPTT
jgi:uncharacterized damage-inducible protein DinB